MRYSFRRPISLLGILALTGCTGQAPIQQQFVVTPEPGRPAFQKTAVPTETGRVLSGSGTAYPAPPTKELSAYPGMTATSHSSVDGRSESALTSYKVAEEAARKELSPDAQLYAINPSNIMLGNLGNPPVLPGWFYTFKKKGTRRQLIVQVVDKTVTGTTLAEPLEEPKPLQLPIDLSTVKLDSPQVFEHFQKFAVGQNIATNGVTFDLELVNLEGKGGPIWSVVDPVTKKWLYSISAANGVEMPDPHK